ncbi:MAG: RNA methyltransferase [Cyclobacteriaceae bacterium]|nr:RNA methyltransferase [Cyclobacteriaceae bacterium]
MSDQAALTEFLAPYVSDHKKALMEEVMRKRTRYLTVVLENIYHPHNASAVVRSCDCFGVQDIHIIEGDNEYNINPYVVRGSANWVSLYKYQQSETKDNCFDQLKSNGYKLVGTSPNPEYKSINEYLIDEKTALVFGQEESGLSDFANSQMDDFIHIPMVGFTESFNISVSVAICLFELSNKIRRSEVEWQLSDDEKGTLTLEWYKNIIARSDVLEREYLRISNVGN